jgi:hypothetical protein
VIQNSITTQAVGQQRSGAVQWGFHLSREPGGRMTKEDILSSFASSELQQQVQSLAGALASATGTAAQRMFSLARSFWLSRPMPQQEEAALKAAAEVLQQALPLLPHAPRPTSLGGVGEAGVLEAAADERGERATVSISSCEQRDGSSDMWCRGCGNVT